MPNHAKMTREVGEISAFVGLTSPLLATSNVFNFSIVAV
jgi:hypothetical protein